MNGHGKQMMESSVKYIYVNNNLLLKGALCLLRFVFFIKRGESPLSVLNTFWMSFAVVVGEYNYRVSI